MQQNQSTSERRESVTEEDIQLKRKLIERMDKSDQEFKENLERINRTMENTGH